MSTTSNTVLKIMNVVFWIVFIGLCIKTGAIITSFCVSLFVNSQGASDLYMGLNLGELYAFSKYHYIATVSLLIALYGIKAFIAYLVVKIFMKFNYSSPFNSKVTSLITRISYYALNAGVLSIIASGYTKWLMNHQGVNVPIDWAGEEILFFAGVLYIVSLVFKKGTELQTENDLTV
jgi:hypothetical protein